MNTARGIFLLISSFLGEVLYVPLTTRLLTAIQRQEWLLVFEVVLVTSAVIWAASYLLISVFKFASRVIVTALIVTILIAVLVTYFGQNQIASVVLLG
jgi:hypothetical protein